MLISKMRVIVPKIYPIITIISSNVLGCYLYYHNGIEQLDIIHLCK